MWKILLFLCIPVISYGQIFNFSTQLHEIKPYDINLSGFVSYSDTGITAGFFNESEVKAEVTGIYLLKPDFLTNNPTLLSGLAKWSEANSFASGDVSGLPFNKLRFSDYYGINSDSPNNTGLGQNQSAFFSWEVETDYSLFNLEQFSSKDKPHVIVRWKSVYDGEDSAKGFAFINLDDQFITPVPEPSGIAALSVALLGGSLIFKRFRRQRSK